MNKITEKWNTTGLLDAVETELDKILLSQNLQNASTILIGSKHKEIEIIAGLFLPIIVRLFTDKNLRIIDDMNKLFLDFVNFFEKNRNLIDDLNGYISQDGEREFCEMFVDIYEV